MPTAAAATPAGPVDAKHVGQPELLRNDQHRRIDLDPEPARRHHDDDPWNTGNDRRRPDLHQHRREGALPARDEEGNGLDRPRLFSDEEPGRDLLRPRGAVEHALVEGADVGDPLADRPHEVVAHATAGGNELLLGDAESVGRAVDLVMGRQRPNDGGVTVQPNVLDDGAYLCGELLVEDP